MATAQNPYQLIISRLKEREKELKCLYRIEETLKNEDMPLDIMFSKIIKIIPYGWQYPTICEVKITHEGKEYTSDLFSESKWMITSSIYYDHNYKGNVIIAYTQLIKEVNGSQFLPEEKELLNMIADRLSSYLFHRKLKTSVKILESRIPEKSITAIDPDQILTSDADEHWQWRLHIVEKMSMKLDFKAYGVKGIYLIGSVKNATAGPASDIDLLIHITGNRKKRDLLKAWFEGWSFCLSEINYQKTGHDIKDGLVDLHLVTDEDIEKKNSFATMITSRYDKARPIRVL